MFAFTALRFRTLPRRAARPLVAALALAALLGTVVPARAQKLPDLPPAVNLQHTLLVRKALAQDEELSRLNLGVRVHNRVATVWGPVPSTKAMIRVIKVARSVPEIVSVQNF